MAGDWPQDARPMTRVIGSDGSASLTFTVPAGVVVAVESVVATVDVAGVASTARLIIEDDAGAVIAEKRQSSSIPPNTLDRATWALRLADDGAGTLPPSRAVWAEMTGAQSIPNNTLTGIHFTAVNYEYGEWIDLGVDNTKCFVPDDGFYVAVAQAFWNIAPAAIARRSVFINLNGSLEGGMEIGPIQTVGIHQEATLSRFLSAGDFLAVSVLQVTGLAYTLGALDFTVTRVGTLVQ